MDIILETNNLCKKYGELKALDNINMHINRGEIYGLIGQNGAGKTTLIRIIAGMQYPTSGSFKLYGADYGTKAMDKARRRLGGIVETPALQQSLSARDNLKAQSILCGCPSSKISDELLDYVGLSGVSNRCVRDMSLGMRQRLAIAVALVGNPDFLILDEPTNGLDPRGIIEIRELIIKLNREKRITVLISSHILSELSKLATFYGFIDNGRAVQEISAAELHDKCKKKHVLFVNDAIALSAVFDTAGLNYKIRENNTVDVFGDVTADALFDVARSAGIKITDLRCEEEDLESYYMNLIGGRK